MAKAGCEFNAIEATLRAMIQPKCPAQSEGQKRAWPSLFLGVALLLSAGIWAVSAAESSTWWAFEPLRVKAPAGQAPPSIDAFIAAKAAQKGLRLAPAAAPEVLVRRATLDLLGIPPAPEEIDAFSADPSDSNWNTLVDWLLSSPEYGERWARHWLDVARFAESSGFEHDYDREGAYHYRDFVIRALNDDLPFDQFVRWQLAGDEFEPDNPLALMATGFLGAGVFPTQITANEVERTRYDAMDDMLSTTGSAFLGLSIGCARCHDHKYDPIPAAEYYKMLATFTTTVRSVVDLDVAPARTRELTRQWEAEREPLQAALRRQEVSMRPGFEQWLAQAGAELSPGGWVLLEPSDLASKAGAQFRSLGDGSFLAEGRNGAQEEYTFTATTHLAGIKALRLDALAHPSMPKGGPGRAENGNFALSRIRVYAGPLESEDLKEIKLASAEADFEQNKTGLSVASALDDDPKSGWAIDGQVGKDHAAFFHLKDPWPYTNGAKISVKLEFEVNNKHNIGRPRLALTAAAKPQLGGEPVPGALAKLAASEDPKALLAAERESLFQWWKRRDSVWKEQSAKLEDHVKKKPDGRTKVLICGEGYTPLRMHTQGADFFPETYQLKRGSTDLKDGVADQDFLKVLMQSPDGAKAWQKTPPTGAKYSGRRSALAHWMTDTQRGAGALLARVAVNRLWQHHFGRGLVSTPNDFGKTGQPPTHPELLDWLASELIRADWRLKPIHRLIMTSAAYRQSSAPDRAKELADPGNELWTRRVPRRLEGESIRDSILAVSGVLDRTMYGPGTKDEKSRRRSIYFTVKRSQLIGSMVAFDLPEPLVSQGERPRTTVAPQALLLLNGPQVRDWAAHFAERVRRSTDSDGDDRLLVQQAYRIALGRLPTGSEMHDAVEFLAAQRESYALEKHPASSTQALADFCQVIFGLNEFAYEN